MKSSDKAKYFERILNVAQEKLSAAHFGVRERDFYKLIQKSPKDEPPSMDAIFERKVKLWQE